MKFHRGLFFLFVILFFYSIISCKKEEPVQQSVKEPVVEEKVKPYDAEADKAGEASKNKAAKTPTA